MFAKEAKDRKGKGGTWLKGKLKPIECCLFPLMSVTVGEWQNRHYKQQVPLSRAAVDAQKMPEERMTNT